ncbi:MAG: HlyD family efflux transporter periplasmic adaptor subunit [Candidatus Magasanikbacteria bacterium]|jgi:RND family efflux transporter MFP subunit|nr:HlyD family efflux transporter periplasmic adaptor subunit [Candidatus Magasanikbacteria bacterium]MBT4350849.1 HlyD family efflux transporter periplasmic adaptor subunit [Candidatus Magasanikbacteria bacterium]MBT6253427.1 HlyD family efflux transporter periplasmic adaptor subunit [Candidatus Magasanikbacteria bacterium]MBT6334655.1 HlyD family efflux transporter periplasmic adaptor subunit [Candidatus Magasanikbacteria bacterium]
MKKLGKRKNIIIIISVIIVILIIALIVGKGEEIKEYSSIDVERSDLIQSVNETGSVTAETDIRYGWEVSGRIVDIKKKAGDEVKKGDIVAFLAGGKQQARLNEAFAAYRSAQAKLNLEITGVSNEEKRKAEASVTQAEAGLTQARAQKEKTVAKVQLDIDNAQKALEDAKNDLQLVEGGLNSQLVKNSYNDLLNTLKSAINKLDETLTESDNILGVDNIFANDEFQNVLGIESGGSLQTAISSYNTAKLIKQTADSNVIQLTEDTPQSDIDSAAIVVQSALTTMQTHLFNTQQVLNGTIPVGNLSQSELETLQANITTARTTINTSQTNTTGDIQAVQNAKNSLFSFEIAYTKAELTLENTIRQGDADKIIADATIQTEEAKLAQAQASYDLLIAPPRNVDIASLQADVNRQGANVQALQDDVNKTKLIALADGIIANLNIEVGENVTANQEVITLISSQLTIEVDVSESDIAKVSIGDNVNITLDAFGDDTIFNGSVVSVEPGETEISGVIYYKTDIVLEEITEVDVRSGMTANIDIITNMKEQALTVPQRAIIKKDGKQIVRILTNEKTGEFFEREVVSGIRGDAGQTEIISGIEEGEKIITFIKE